MLRPYQSGSLEAAKKAVNRGVRRMLIQLPTGTGKTVVFANIPDFFEFTGKILVLVHREELAQQAASKLKKWNPGKTVGIEMGDYRSLGTDQIVVASVQSMRTRASKFNPREFDCIVCDEAHHSTADSYVNVFEFFGVFDESSRTCLIGVTATPNRADGQGLNTVYQEIVYEMSILDAIEQGWLADLKGIRVNTQVDIDEVHTRAGDFAQDELEKTINTPARNELIVREWLKHAPDKQTIAFCVDIQHGKDLARAFQEFGVAAEAVWGTDPHRAEKLAAHKAGGLTVLCNAQVLTEGYDDWRIKCVIMAKPTKSQLLYTQMAGRGTRIPDFPDGISLLEARKLGLTIEKDSCLLLDVVDVTKRHSLVTLPSLLGMNSGLDLKGKSVVAALREMEQAQKAHPGVDLSKLADISRLNSYAEEVDLFKVVYPDEVIKHSKFAWHRAFDGSYVLLLTGGEQVVIRQDMLNQWHIVGTVKKNRFVDKASSFEAGIKQADDMVQILGGRDLTALVKREAKWHGKKPSDRLLALAKRLRINVPEGATSGEVTAAINRFFANKPNRRRIDSNRR